MLKIKRAYEPPAPDDGARYLVDRMWPRGQSKDKLKVAAWLKEIAPSAELRAGFYHEAERWPQFQALYRQELAQSEKQAVLERLAQETRQGSVTLVYAAKDPERNNALVLFQVLEERLAARP